MTNDPRHDALMQLRQDLVDQLEDRTGAADTVVLDQAMVGRLSRMDAMQHQEVAKAQRRRAEARLVKVEMRLRQHAEGDEAFGCCLDCFEPIPPARLAELPDAERCVPCVNERRAETGS